MRKRLIAIISVLVVVTMLFACGKKKDEQAEAVKDDSSILEAAKDFVTGSEDTQYEKDMTALRAEVKSITKQSPIDKDALWAAYKLLLKNTTDEAMFKSMAHGYFTDTYETDTVNELIAERNKIVNEMIKYFAEDVVNDEVTVDGINAYNTFDDEVFNYDWYKVMDGDSIDIDAMWARYYEDPDWIQKPDPEEQATIAASTEWETWTDDIGEFEFSLEYPKAWEEYGVTIQSEPNISVDGDRMDISLALCLDDFSDGESPTEVLKICYATCNTDEADGNVDDSTFYYRLENPFGEFQPVFHFVKGGIEYRLDLVYEFYHHYDVKEWRKADWEENVRKYFDYIGSTVTASQVDAVG